MITKDRLLELYVVMGKTQAEVGNELGIGRNKVRALLKKYNIPIRSHNDRIYQEKRRVSYEPLIPIDYLHNYYLTKKKTINQIAKEFGITWDSVRKRISAAGLPMMYEKMKGKRRSSRTVTELKQFQKEVFNHYGYVCAVCGYSKIVHAHHIVPWSMSGDNTVYNGIPLCPNHHAEADYGILTQDILRNYQTIKK